MEWFFNWPIMLIWSFCILLLFRVLLVSINRRIFDIRKAFKVTYIVLALFPVLGLIMLSASGMPMYGFDNKNLAHQFGWFVMFLSPFGLPFFLGLPIVLIYDFFRRPWEALEAKP